MLDTPMGTAERPVLAYTDGSCIPNPGHGGWAFVYVPEAGDAAPDEDITSHFGVGGENTTNSRMELQAALEAIKGIPEGSHVRIVTDSAYVSGGLVEWLPAWKRRGGRKANGKRVENWDLWLRIDEFMATRSVTAEWIKGHAGNRWNELADSLASMARQIGETSCDRLPRG